MFEFSIPPELIKTLREARQIAVLTGAGISAESGVPTFREAQTGLWAQYDPQELATPEAFRRNPKLVWEWYAWRRQLVSQADPNPGHLALARLESIVPNLIIITQNVDGLHKRAGSRAVVALHGNIMETKCFAHDHSVSSWPDSETVPPRCPECGSWLRPDVVWFGENLPSAAFRTAVETAQSCDLFMAIGTSAIVQPAASLPLLAVQHGAVAVEINPSETPLTAWMDFVLAGAAGEVLPAIVAELTSQSPM